MDKQKSSIQEMEEAFAAIQIEDEEHGGLCYENDNEDLSDIDMRWCLIGKFLTDSPIDYQAMQHKMASLWRPGKGLYVKQLESNRFIFQFYHEIDIKRVIDGSPWTFGRFHLVLERLKDGNNPRTIEINKIDLWVQLHGMNTGFMSQRVATDIGNYIGNYVEGDPNNFVGVWREYLRIRVSIPLNVPIKRRMKLKKSDKDWCWVNFQYEAIPTFCFICGLIGHGERYCERIFESPDEIIEKPYGSWLRAEPRRRSHTMGSKWLRSGGNSQGRFSGDGGKKEGDKSNPDNGAQGKQISVDVGSTQQTVKENELTGKTGGVIGIGISCQDGPYQINIQNSKIPLEANEFGPNSTDLIVTDPKRRRMDSDVVNDNSITQEQDTEMETQENNNMVSKNDLMAGTALQSRQSL